MEAAIDEVTVAAAEPRLEVSRMLQLHDDYLSRPEALDCCDACAEEGGVLLDPVNTRRLLLSLVR